MGKKTVGYAHSFFVFSLIGGKKTSRIKRKTGFLCQTGKQDNRF